MKQKFFGILVPLGIVLLTLSTGVLLDFLFFYPLFMSFMWIIGGIYFYLHFERHSRGPEFAPLLKESPFVSILIPCFNEGINAAETIDAADRQNYPSFEIIAINDGSSDDTQAVLEQLELQYPRLRIVLLAQNQGKAMALRMGALVARGEYLVCIDGDALLDKNATAYLVKPMIENPRVGAVTGNPRVRTRSTILGKIQVGEFSSIIGLIKRSQRIYGQIFTVSGVIAAFRRRALHDCGYWDLNMITEDIDISWKLQMRHWQIQYEPCALTWILMPETLRGLWKQRLRWAQGGAENFFKNLPRLLVWRNRRMWMLLVDFSTSTAWVFSYALSVFLWALGKYVHLSGTLNVPSILPQAFWGLALGSVCLCQFAVALIVERRYDYRLLHSIGWIIWYPLLFWLLFLLTTLVGFCKAVFKDSDKRGRWSTTDRGFQ